MQTTNTWKIMILQKKIMCNVSWRKQFYGWAKSRYFPCSKFKWVNNCDNFDVNSISKTSEYGSWS